MSKSAVSRSEVVTETSRSVTVELKSSNQDDDPSAKENLKGFMPLVGIAQVFGLLGVILIIYWAFKYAGGLGFENHNVFNWHAILLSISFIYLTGNGILAFRILREWPKPTLKLVHASIKGISLVLAVLGALAVFSSKSKNNYAHYYSLHSWVGVLTVVVYIAQTFGGLYAFLFPGIQMSSRAALMPYHRFFGQILLGLAILAAVSGINEMAYLRLQTAYGERVFEGVLLNFAGIFFTLFGILVLYIVCNVDFKRYPRFDDNVPNRSK